MLNRQDILAKKSLRRELIEIPEWGGTVYVRELSAEERTQYEIERSDLVMGEQKDPKEKAKRFVDMRARGAVLGTINEDGTQMFLPDDVKTLNELSGSALDKISSAILTLSGYTTAERDRLKKTSNAVDDDSSLDLPLH